MIKDIVFKSPQHVIDEVRNMNVKGGSPFGRAAAWAYYLVCTQENFSDRDALIKRFDEISAELLRLKPTMATIYNSKHLVYEKVNTYSHDSNIADITAGVTSVCQRIIDCSHEAVDRLGLIGANLIEDGDTVLMHSYSSSLMSVFIAAVKQGRKFDVICTESRPLRESRVAAKILQKHLIPVTYITDASVWEFMPSCDLIIMGADTITWDGCVANKMGTALISQLALDCKKPVYIASEVFKLDLRTAQGHPVALERRTKDEIIFSDDFESLEGITIINQFFDLTPANQITGLITEYGLIPPALISQKWGLLEKKLLGE